MKMSRQYCHNDRSFKQAIACTFYRCPDLAVSSQTSPATVKLCAQQGRTQVGAA
jgi:hypothetical protein